MNKQSPTRKELMMTVNSLDNELLIQYRKVDNRLPLTPKNIKKLEQVISETIAQRKKYTEGDMVTVEYSNYQLGFEDGNKQVGYEVKKKPDLSYIIVLISGILIGLIIKII